MLGRLLFLTLIASATTWLATPLRSSLPFSPAIKSPPALARVARHASIRADTSEPDGTSEPEALRPLAEPDATRGAPSEELAALEEVKDSSSWRDLIPPKTELQKIVPLSLIHI